MINMIVGGGGGVDAVVVVVVGGFFFVDVVVDSCVVFDFARPPNPSKYEAVVGVMW
jgi:hypothetical protein